MRQRLDVNLGMVESLTSKEENDFPLIYYFMNLVAFLNNRLATENQ